MKQTIYVDVLIAVNLFINYFILIATAKFLYIKVNKIRILLASLLGAMYSLYILLPDMNIVLSLIIKALMASTIVWAAFCGPKSNIYLKCLICFCLLSFVFSGTMFAIWCILGPNGLFVNNGVVYFNISPMILIVSTVVSYMIIQTINNILGRQKDENSFCVIKIKILTDTVEVRAKVDTGNSLREPFSGLPVVVVREEALKGILPEDWVDSVNYKRGDGLNCGLRWKIRLIPFSSIAGNGLLPSFKADYITVDGSNPKKEAYIAVCPNDAVSEDFDALVSPELVR